MKVLAVLMAVMAFGAVAQAANTPADGSQNTDALCLLDNLTFTNGVQIVGQFHSNIFHYQCSCPTVSGPLTTNVIPHMLDPGSTAEVKFNGVNINTKAGANAISNAGNVALSPNTQSSDLQFTVGWNTVIVGVSCNGISQPPCYYEYEIRCYRPPNDGGYVVGDPQFVGLRGQSYQVHGVSGEVYNIVSDKDLQYNSRFVFLNEGECPVVNGKKQKGCWSHPGSYLGELGLKTRAGDKIRLVSGDAKTGFETVEVNGQRLGEGETVLLADDMGSVSLNSTHLASVQIGKWDFAFENSDKFVNQRVRVLDARGLRSHGLLGQTWRDTTYPNAIKYIQGQVDDYVIRDGDVFGDNFVFNTFN